MESELKSAFSGLETKLDGIGERVQRVEKRTADWQRQLDAVDQKTSHRAVSGGGHNDDALETALSSSDAVSRLLKEKHGSGAFLIKDRAFKQCMSRKTTITETAQGFMTTGVMPIDRVAGIVPEARQQLFVRDLLYARPTTMALVDFVRVQTPLSIASPVPEASTKPENQLQFQSLSEKIRTLATWIPASKQILDDMTELMGFIQSSMPYYVNLAEELQLLSGDGTGENLHGLIPQAAAWLGGSPAVTRIDAIGSAIEQIQAAKEIPPTFVVIHPADFWGMRLLKDSLGRYILGSPSQGAPATIFDLTPVVTTSISKGQFLVGSGSPIAAEIRDRMEMQVEISTEHSTFFIQNLVAVRAEKRLALVVKRPNSFIVGSFSGLN